MDSVCTVPAREGRSCEHFVGYKTINRIPLPLPLQQTHSEGPEITRLTLYANSGLISH